LRSTRPAVFAAALDPSVYVECKCPETDCARSGWPRVLFPWRGAGGV